MLLKWRGLLGSWRDAVLATLGARVLGRGGVGPRLRGRVFLEPVNNTWGSRGWRGRRAKKSGSLVHPV